MRYLAAVLLAGVLFWLLNQAAPDYMEMVDDYTDTGVGCIDDCLDPASDAEPIIE